MSRSRSERGAAVAPAPEPRAKVLRASVTMTLDGPGGPCDVTAELPPDGLALLESLSGDAPSVDEVASAAQKMGELRLILLRSYPELVPEVDRVAAVLRRIPGVAAELERRRLGRCAR